MANLSDKYKNSLPFESSNITTITSNYTALDNDVVFVNTASSSLTVTLPASPTTGSKIKVLDISSNSQNNNIIILGNGQNIGGASAYTINTPDSSAEFLFVNSIKGWNILNEYISLTKPGIPTGVSAVDVGTGRAYNNGAATVSFTPSNSGDSATSFTATSTPGEYTATGTSSPITITGLQSGVSYTFKVSASNSVGTSTESVASSSITATTIPQAPTLSSLTSGFERVVATFTNNATGGKSITSNTVTPAGLSGTIGSSPLNVTSLIGGTTYSFSVTATNENGTSAASNVISEIPFTASGGSISTYSNYRVHTFSTSSNFVLTGKIIPVDYLIIAGGGGGGGGSGDDGPGGGGGAGGYLTGSFDASIGNTAVAIGGGGSGSGGQGSNGENSSITGVVTPLGGGGGGFRTNNGNSGGSGGGGGGWTNFTRTGGSGTSGQGNRGGDGSSAAGGAGRNSGGGGGAGSAGSSSTPGSGATSDITGTSVVRASGGAGKYGTAVAGGGGSVGGNGTPNTGGGGGGSINGGTGGNGGSGVVIIRYTI
jgi:hypothetical protein